MDKQGAEFLKRLLATFKAEADEHVQSISTGLIELEKVQEPGPRNAIIEAIFRQTHSLKGAARSVNLTEFERLCQAMESLFSAWKRGEVSYERTLFDALHESIAFLRTSLADPHLGESAAESSAGLVRRLESASHAAHPVEEGAADSAAAVSPHTAPPVPPSPAAARTAADTVRIRAARLSAILYQAEEMVGAKLALAQHAEDLRAISAGLAAWRREWVKPGHAESAALSMIEHRLAELSRDFKQDCLSLATTVDGLLQDVQTALMLPFSSLLDFSPSLVRELAREQGKEVALAIHGASIEIDRRILEEMKDPITHLLRNCVAHGIELPEERSKRQKKEEGSISVRVIPRNGSRVELVIADDGAGIDAKRVAAAAQEMGLITAEAAASLDERESLELVFHSGVTTSPVITKLSGRGLGLAIVREKVERLGGSLHLESLPGKGTTFRILLPLTLAAFRGVLVRVGEHRLLFPTPNVERVIRFGRDEVRTVENRETLWIDGTAVSLARLADVLELAQPQRQENGTFLTALMAMAASQRIAYVVDEVLGEQQVLAKGFGKQLSRLRNVGGAALLGSGDVVPVMNVQDLFKSAVKMAGAPSAITPKPVAAAGQRRILVVEDSITTRALLKSILETEGYSVRTAVDGMDALMQLRTEDADLVVSDVDMPRMGGFDLTARIRADQRLSKLPIVLVTALESREDRERGIDVGANAYIVKSNFDQSDLVAVVRRLL